MIGGLPLSAIAQLRSQQDDPTPAPAPIQSAPAQPAPAGLPSALMLAQLLKAKQPPQRVPAAPPSWRDQPMYAGGGYGGQTWNSMGGGKDWRTQPVFLPVDTSNPGGKFTLADPLGGLLHAVGIHGFGPAEWNNRGFFGLGLRNWGK